jgi:cation:H+ antiporter
MVSDWFIDGSEWTGLSRSDALVLLAFFAIFVYYVVNHAIAQIREAEEDGDGPVAVSMSIPKAFLLILVGLACLALGGDWVVDGATEIALSLGVTEKFVALTIVAAGTSLPELATSAVAAYRKNADIALGNIVGSSIFNLFFVLGVAATVRPIPFDTVLIPDMFVMIAAGVLLFLCMFTWGIRRTVQRHEGAVYLVIYVGYLGYVVYRG